MQCLHKHSAKQSKHGAEFVLPRLEAVEASTGAVPPAPLPTSPCGYALNYPKAGNHARGERAVFMSVTSQQLITAKSRAHQAFVNFNLRRSMHALQENFTAAELADGSKRGGRAGMAWKWIALWRGSLLRPS